MFQNNNIAETFISLENGLQMLIENIEFELKKICENFSDNFDSLLITFFIVKEFCNNVVVKNNELNQLNINNFDKIILQVLVYLLILVK